MPLNLVKLCVGVETVDDLKAHVAERLAAESAAGRPAEQKHPTRMVPRRASELLDGGSLYWVVRGHVEVRQRILDIRPFTDAEGIGRCHLVLEPTFVLTQRQFRRPFQGWRYLEADKAPSDLGHPAAEGEIPADLERELHDLGLL